MATPTKPKGISLTSTLLAIKKELIDRGLSTSGKDKAELFRRLQEHDEKKSRQNMCSGKGVAEKSVAQESSTGKELGGKVASTEFQIRGQVLGGDNGDDDDDGGMFVKENLSRLNSNKVKPSALDSEVVVAEELPRRQAEQPARSGTSDGKGVGGNVQGGKRSREEAVVEDDIEMVQPPPKKSKGEILEERMRAATKKRRDGERLLREAVEEENRIQADAKDNLKKELKIVISRFVKYGGKGYKTFTRTTINDIFADIDG